MMDSHLSWARFERSAIKERVYKQTNRVKNYGRSVPSSLGCKSTNNEVALTAEPLQALDFFSQKTTDLRSHSKGSFRLLKSVQKNEMLMFLTNIVYFNYALQGPEGSKKTPGCRACSKRPHILQTCNTTKAINDQTARNDESELMYATYQRSD